MVYNERKLMPMYALKAREKYLRKLLFTKIHFVSELIEIDIRWSVSI